MVLPNWAEAYWLLFWLCSQRLVLKPSLLDGTIVGALSCCTKTLFFVGMRLVKQLWPHALHPPSLNAFQDFLHWLLILALLF